MAAVLLTKLAVLLKIITLPKLHFKP